jgi:transposase-like protein
VLLAQGKTTAEVSRSQGITEHTYYRWRKEYGGTGTQQALRLKELEEENARLSRAGGSLAGKCHLERDSQVGLLESEGDAGGSAAMKPVCE